MDDKPDIVPFGIALLFGTVVPAGVLYVLRGLGPALDGSSSFVVPVVWFVAVTLGALSVGRWLRVPTDALLGGGIIGTGIGFWAFATAVGWSFVMFAIVPIAIVAVISGTWAAYERDRRHGEATEPPYGTWRHVFVMLAVPLIALPVLLLLV